MADAQQYLDQVQSPAKIAAVEAEPGEYATRVAAELATASTLGELEVRDDRSRHALTQLDAMIERVARIRFDHALGGEPGLAAPTRKVFAATLIGYADRLELLASRAMDAAVRGGAREPSAVAAMIVDGARSALDLRAAMQAEVLAVVRRGAATAVADADRRAKDRDAELATRKKWSAMRRELEAVAADPARLASGTMRARIAEWPEQIDDPEAEPEKTFAELIEID